MERVGRGQPNHLTPRHRPRSRTGIPSARRWPTSCRPPPAASERSDSRRSGGPAPGTRGTGKPGHAVRCSSTTSASAPQDDRPSAARASSQPPWPSRPWASARASSSQQALAGHPCWPPPSRWPRGPACRCSGTQRAHRPSCRPMGRDREQHGRRPGHTHRGLRRQPARRRQPERVPGDAGLYTGGLLGASFVALTSWLARIHGILVLDSLSSQDKSSPPKQSRQHSRTGTPRRRARYPSRSPSRTHSPPPACAPLSPHPFPPLPPPEPRNTSCPTATPR